MAAAPSIAARQWSSPMKLSLSMSGTAMTPAWAGLPPSQPSGTAGSNVSKGARWGGRSATAPAAASLSLGTEWGNGDFDDPAYGSTGLAYVTTCLYAGD